MKKFLALAAVVLVILAFNYDHTKETINTAINQLFVGQAGAIDDPGNREQQENNNPGEPENNEQPGEQQESYLERTVYVNEEGKKIIKDPENIQVLVNKERNLPAGFTPPNLVKPDIPFPFEEDLPKKQMRQVAARPLENLFQAAREEGMDLFGLSGYRSYDTQKRIFEYKARQRGEEVANQTSARPGQSEHQTGLTMDVTSPKVNFGLVQSFGDTAEGKWLEENAADFGFILRYPRGKEDITGYSYEPWHLRYVGEDMARDIAEQGVTLEEYLQDYTP